MHSTFYRTKIKKTTFKKLAAHEVDFTECDLTGSMFDHCDLERAMFQNTVIEKVDFGLRTIIRLTPSEQNKESRIFDT